MLFHVSGGVHGSVFSDEHVAGENVSNTICAYGAPLRYAFIPPTEKIWLPQGFYLCRGLQLGCVVKTAARPFVDLYGDKKPLLFVHAQGLDGQQRKL